MQTATDKLHISRHLEVKGKFKEVENGYEIEYTFYSYQCTFKRSPVAMANLLQLYGFIDSYFATTATVYVKHTDGDGREHTDLLEDYMDRFSQPEAIMLLIEWQYREQCRKERAEAFQLSCDAKQERQLIN